LRKNLINYLINERLIKIGKSRTHEYISDFIQKGKLIDDNSFLKLSEK